MSDKVSNAKRLADLCGFDPVKKPTASHELFAEVLGDIRKEREEKAKVAAREQLTKAIELSEKMDKVKREFEGQYAKFEKELGKMLNRLESSLSGKPVVEEEKTED